MSEVGSGLVNWRRLVIFARAGGELIRVTDTYRGPTFGSATHVGVTLGTGALLRLSTRVAARADAQVNLYPVQGQAVGQLTSQGAAVGTAWTLAAGLDYRLGGIQRADPTRSPSLSRRMTIGSALVLSVGASELACYAELKQAGIGAFVPYALTPYFELDGTVSFLPTEYKFHSPFDGGRTVDGLGGSRLGRWTGRVSSFVDLSAGAEVNSAVLVSSNAATDTFGLRRISLSISG